MAFAVVPPTGAAAVATHAPAAYEVLGPGLQPVTKYRYPLPPLTATQLHPGGGEAGCLTPPTPFNSLTEATAAATGGAMLGVSSPCGAALFTSYSPGLGPSYYPLQSQPQLQPPNRLSCCPNVYSHNGAYALTAPPRMCDTLGGSGNTAATSAAVVAAAAAAMAGGAGFSFTHGFILEFPPSNALTHNLVSLRFLGPHSAALGQPTHMTWLVTRVSSPPSVAATAAARESSPVADDVAVYEVAETAEVTDGGGVSSSRTVLGAGSGVTGVGGGGGGGPWQWRQAMGCRGSIHLGRAKGSVAVVEAVVVPSVVGVLRAPVLRLRGLREVREEEMAAAEYVVVEAAQGL